MFFYANKTCLKGKKLIIIFLEGGGGGGIFFCLLPPFDLHFGFFKIKSLVPRTSNLRDSTDIPFKYQDNINPRYCNRKASR